MPNISVRNLPEATHRALKLRAAQKKHSVEAEIRAILNMVSLPVQRIKIGSELAAFGKQLNITQLDISRDTTLPEPASFE